MLHTVWLLLIWCLGLFGATRGVMALVSALALGRTSATLAMGVIVGGGLVAAGVLAIVYGIVWLVPVAYVSRHLIYGVGTLLMSNPADDAPTGPSDRD